MKSGKGKTLESWMPNVLIFSCNRVALVMGRLSEREGRENLAFDHLMPEGNTFYWDC